jgi:hypothetical protein
MWIGRSVSPEDLSFVFNSLRRYLIRIERNMATQAELDAKLDELNANVAFELQQLKDAVAATAPDLAPQVAKVQAAIDALKSDDPAPPAPPPAPAP